MIVGDTQISGIIDKVIQLVMTVILSGFGRLPISLRSQLKFSVISEVLVQPPHHSRLFQSVMHVIKAIYIYFFFYCQCTGKFMPMFMQAKGCLLCLYFLLCALPCSKIVLCFLYCILINKIRQMTEKTKFVQTLCLSLYPCLKKPTKDA